jgi:hypothetical protein
MPRTNPFYTLEKSFGGDLVRVKGWGGERIFCQGRRARGDKGTSRGKSMKLGRRKNEARIMRARKNGDFEKGRGVIGGQRGVDQTR